MKAYLVTTGVLFAIVTLLHLARTGEIVGQLHSDPWFVVEFTLLTLLSAALSVWAWRLVTRLPGAPPPRRDGA